MSSIEHQIIEACRRNDLRLGALFGVYLGYPHCRIDSFLEAGFPRPDAHNPMFGTGYVPCEKCSRKSDKELIDAIAERRLCDTPFPECHDYLITFKHFTDMVLQGKLRYMITN